MSTMGKAFRWAELECVIPIDPWLDGERPSNPCRSTGRIPSYIFCPLNINGNHFTLLEINERESVIYHYDSKADQGIIDGRAKQTRVGNIIEVRMGLCDCDINMADVISERV